MKKLLLFSILLIFACSSDDSSSSDDNDLIEETFLERYDGVIWQILDDSGEAGETYVRFNNDLSSFITFNFSVSFNGKKSSECIYLNDDFDSEGSEITILINSGDIFAISETDVESTVLTTFTATNGGNILEMEVLDPNEPTETISLPRASLTEIPCP